MAWFDDNRLKNIHDSGIAEGVLSEDCFIIRRKLAILRATRSRKSHWLAGAPLSVSDGRHAVRISADWSISFDWIEDFGPFRMRLESLRRKNEQ